MALFFTPVKGKETFQKDWTTTKLSQVQASQQDGATGIALVHGPSNTCAFDFDDLEWCIEMFNKCDLDIVNIIKSHFRITSPKPNRAKAVFLIPPNITLEYLKLPAYSNSTKLELRCGNRYDVWPGSQYPDGGTYIQEGSEEILPLPPELLDLWQACIKYRDKERQYAPKGTSGELPLISNGKMSVIHVFNVNNTLQDVLHNCGYLQRGNKWQSPHSMSGSYGLTCQASYMNSWDLCFSHHESDGELSGRPVDAFEIAASFAHPDIELDQAKRQFTAEQAKKLKAIDAETREDMEKTVHEFNNPIPKIESSAPKYEEDKYTRNEWPPGFTGLVAKELHKFMTFPNKELAINGTLFIVSVIAGRKDSFKRNGIVMVWVVMAVTGTGKDSTRKFYSLIMSELKSTKLKADDAEVSIDLPTPELDGFTIMHGTYGIQAIHGNAVKSPSFGMIISEAGLSTKSNAGNLDAVKANLMQNQAQDAYEELSFPAYSDGIPKVHGVQIPRYVESTKEAYKHNFKISQHSTGESAREFKIFADYKPDSEAVDNYELPREVIEGFQSLYDEAIRGENYGSSSVNIKNRTFTGPSLGFIIPKNKHLFKADDRTEARIKELKKIEHQRRQEVSEDDAGNQEWAQKSRYGQMCGRLAFLLARTDCRVYKTETVVKWEHFEYAEKYVTEVHRAERANASDYDNLGDNLIEEIYRYCCNWLEKPPGWFMEMHEKGAKKANKVYRKALLRNNSKIRSIAQEMEALNSYKTAQQYISETLILGSKIGYWDLQESGKNGVEHLIINGKKTPT